MVNDDSIANIGHRTSQQYLQSQHGENQGQGEKEESQESKDVKKEETQQGVIEEAEEGDVGEYLTKEEDGKCSIVLRKKTEEIEDEIETAEFQERTEIKIVKIRKKKENQIKRQKQKK